ncbi:MAG TPA: hypothetical protein EYP17_06820 [Candidatus Latescibacteria bacterium]|nr:hypothetical protein [Candidatus Latescibacterota bacterium]
MILLLALFLGTSIAQVRTWTVGEGGMSWSSQSEVSVAVDFRDPWVVRPYGFSPGENIVKAVGPWQDLYNHPPKDLRTEGGSRVWNRSSEGFPNAAVVDGDEATSTGESYKQFGVDQTGRTFFFDLGASYPANRIVFYPSPPGREDYIRAFEVSISDGRHFSPEGGPIYEVLRRVEVNREPKVELPFSPQLLRFVKLRVLSSNPFEIAEMEIYGEGFVPRASYLSKLVEFEGGRPVVFGRLKVEATSLGDGREAYVEVRVRDGADDTPLIYYRRDPETQAQEEVSEEEYRNLEEWERGPIRTDAVNWSPWSNPFRIDTTGAFELPLDFLPGPRRYFQFRLQFEGTYWEAMQVYRLSLSYSLPLADSAVGEVALLGQPDPPGGVANTPTGREATFTYDIQAEFRSEGLKGFDGVRIEAPGKPTFVELWMGDPPSDVSPDSVKVGEWSLEVYFPSHRITEDHNLPVRIVFQATPLAYSTHFRGWLLDTGGNLPQPILAGDASREVRTNSLWVFGSLEEPLSDLEVSPVVLTPDGDGTGDATEVSYNILQLVERARVEVEVYDISGRRVREVFSGALDPGMHIHTWDGKDDVGNLVTPGMYICIVSVHTQAEVFRRVRAVTVVY